MIYSLIICTHSTALHLSLHAAEVLWLGAAECRQVKVPDVCATDSVLQYILMCWSNTEKASKKQNTTLFSNKTVTLCECDLRSQSGLVLRFSKSNKLCSRW